MALLIDLKQPVWLLDENLRDDLLKIDAHADIRIGAEPGNLDEIEMLTVSTYFPGEALKYPNLKVIQKTGAGVNNILADDQLPQHIQVTRLQTDTSGNEMAEYSLAYVLEEQRQIRTYHQQQSISKWQAYAPRRSMDTTIAVLGLGRIGQLVAQRFVDNQFNVIGWSRTQKALSGVRCYAGDDGLVAVLAVADYVISVLPSTPSTLGLFNRNSFEKFKPSAILINIGRGDLVNEADLILALDQGLLARAVLDVVCTEPLPEDSPLWTHPGIQITPHVSGWHLGDAIKDIVENYRRLQQGEPLLNLIDRELGY